MKLKELFFPHSSEAPIYGYISFWLAVLGALGVSNKKTRTLGAWLWVILGAAGGAISWDRFSRDHGVDPNIIALRRVWRDYQHDFSRWDTAKSHVPFGIAAIYIIRKASNGKTIAEKL